MGEGWLFGQVEDTTGGRVVCGSTCRVHRTREGSWNVYWQ